VGQGKKMLYPAQKTYMFVLKKIVDCVIVVIEYFVQRVRQSVLVAADEKTDENDLLSHVRRERGRSCETA